MSVEAPQRPKSNFEPGVPVDLSISSLEMLRQRAQAKTIRGTEHADAPQPTPDQPATAPYEVDLEAAGLVLDDFQKRVVAYGAVDAVHGSDHPLATRLRNEFTDKEPTVLYTDERYLVISSLQKIADPKSNHPRQLEAGLILDLPSAKEAVAQNIEAQKSRPSSKDNDSEPTEDKAPANSPQTSEPVEFTPQPVLAASTSKEPSAFTPPNWWRGPNGTLYVRNKETDEIIIYTPQHPPYAGSRGGSESHHSHSATFDKLKALSHKVFLSVSNSIVHTRPKP